MTASPPLHPRLHAVATPEKPALVMAGSGAHVSYGELEARANQGAHLFRSLRLEAGDAVAILALNSPVFLEAVWAAQRAGLYYVSISTKLTPGEVRHILQDSGAKVLVVSTELEPVGREAAAGLEIAVLPCGAPAPAADSLEARRAAFPSSPVADEAPGQDMLYSSGTTGRAKGVRAPARTGGVTDATPLNSLIAKLFGIDADSVFLSPAPLYHAAPLRFVMAAQSLGATVVVMERFDAEAALEAIQRFGVTHSQWVPTHFVRLLRLPPKVRDRYDHATLKVAVHAAAPCPVEVKRAMMEWWGPILYEYYSSTEMIGFTATTPQEWLERPGTVGRALMGRIHICDDAGEELPVGREGVIHFSDGPPLNYHNDPEKTRAAHNAQGWPTIGDVGRLDADGYLFLTDRKSFMIISGGVNIYPQEIENALISHPAVADAAVFGAPDADMGERVVAVVQPVDWARAGAELSEELTTYLRGIISGVKLPRQIDYRRELPRDPSGKLFKRLLADEYRAAARLG